MLKDSTFVYLRACARVPRSNARARGALLTVVGGSHALSIAVAVESRLWIRPFLQVRLIKSGWPAVVS